MSVQTLSCTFLRHSFGHGAGTSSRRRPTLGWLCFAAWLAGCVVPINPSLRAAEAAIRVAVFEIDASPPVGSRMAYDLTKEILQPLSCKGLVILGRDQPIVVTAVDWLGISNESHQLFRERLAAAADTTADRVIVHCLHQHDAPWCDQTSDQLLRNEAVADPPFDSAVAREMFDRAAVAVRAAVPRAQTVTHLRTSQANVLQVASNRRVLGPDGNVLHVRWSATRDPVVRDFPEGVIDPAIKLVTLYHDEQPLCVISSYATHPQSYYRTGKANPDFPGMARNAFQSEIGVPVIHFNGAAGNVTAGKYNDGSPDNREVLAGRMLDGFRAAWTTGIRQAVNQDDLTWKTTPVQLPLAPHLDVATLRSTLSHPAESAGRKLQVACELAWALRTQAGHPIQLSALGLGPMRLLSMPGELFIEYQLAAQEMRPDLFVMMAAYGEYGTAYIGTAISYSQGGYETGPDASFVGPGSEAELIRGISELLAVPEKAAGWPALGVADAERIMRESKSASPQ